MERQSNALIVELDQRRERPADIQIASISIISRRREFTLIRS